jgi:hypothetical protein
MFRQCLFEHLAVAVIVVDGADLGDSAKALKGAQVRFVYVGEVGIGDDDVGQGLDIAQAVGKSGLSEMMIGDAGGQYLVGSSRRQ